MKPLTLTPSKSPELNSSVQEFSKGELIESVKKMIEKYTSASKDPLNNEHP